MIMKNYSIGRIIMVVLWALIVLGIAVLPYEINDYLEVVMLIIALMSIEVAGEAIDRVIFQPKEQDHD